MRTITIVDLNPGGNPQHSEAAARAAVPELAQHPDLFKTVTDLSQNVGFSQVPQVVIDPALGNNAAASTVEGVNMIGIGPEFLSKRTPAEMKGVIGHELAHMTLGHTVGRATAFEKIVGAATLMTPLNVPAALWQSRRHEKAADKEGARIAGDTRGLADSHKKTIDERPPLPSKLGPRLQERFYRRFATHPKEEKRIKALERQAKKETDRQGSLRAPRQGMPEGLRERANLASMSLTGRSAGHKQAAQAPLGMKIPQKIAPTIGSALKGLFKKSSPVAAPALSVAKQAANKIVNKAAQSMPTMKR